MNTDNNHAHPDPFYLCESVVPIFYFGYKARSFITVVGENSIPLRCVNALTGPQQHPCLQ
jgi:hypothetical protein